MKQANTPQSYILSCCKDNKFSSQDDDLQDNDSQAVEEMHVANVIDTNPKDQQMENDVPMGMIELLPLWDQI